MSTAKPRTRSSEAIPPGLEPLTAEAVAAALKISRRTVYEAAERREIPGAFKIGRLLRFRRAELLAWLGQGAPSEE